MFKLKHKERKRGFSFVCLLLNVWLYWVRGSLEGLRHRWYSKEKFPLFTILSKIKEGMGRFSVQ